MGGEGCFCLLGVYSSMMSGSAYTNALGAFAYQHSHNTRARRRICIVQHINIVDNISSLYSLLISTTPPPFAPPALPIPLRPVAHRRPPLPLAPPALFTPPCAFLPTPLAVPLRVPLTTRPPINIFAHSPQ